MEKRIELGPSSRERKINTFGAEQDEAFDSELETAALQFGFPFLEVIEGGKAVAGEIDNLEHDRGILSQGKEEADHKNKRRSEAARAGASRKYVWLTQRSLTLLRSVSVNLAELRRALGTERRDYF